MGSFGIHLGNSSACLAVLREGRLEIVVNEVGDRVTPAIVAYSGPDVLVGLAAKTQLIRDPKNTITRNKVFLDESLTDHEISGLKLKNSCPVVENQVGLVYQVAPNGKDKKVTPEEVTTHILRQLYLTASAAVRASSGTELQAVLCVPLHFNQASRQSLKSAAEEAGFEVLQVIAEPAAAALGHGVGIEDLEPPYRCLVYRVGGFTTDATLFDVTAGAYSVLAAEKSSQGGNDLTLELARYAAQEFRNKWKLDPNESRRSNAKLYQAAQAAKHVLSTVSTAHCFAESLMDGVDLNINVTRARFESLIGANLTQLLEPIKRVLEKANCDSASVRKIVLCGGSVKMPKLQQIVSDLFSSAEILGGSTGDENIALGAAKHASLLTRAVDEDSSHLSMEVSALSSDIYLNYSNEKRIVFPQGTPVPNRRIISHKMEGGNQSFKVDLIENTRNLGSVLLEQIDMHALIDMELAITSNGALSLTLHEKKKKKKAVLRLKAAQEIIET